MIDINIARIFANWDVCDQLDFLSTCWDMLGKQMGEKQRDKAMRVARNEEKTMRFLEAYGGKRLSADQVAARAARYTVDKQTNIDARYTQAEDQRKPRMARLAQNYGGRESFLLNMDTGEVLTLSGQLYGHATDYNGSTVMVDTKAGWPDMLIPKDNIIGWRPPKPLGAESMNEGYSPSSVRSMSSHKQDGYTTRWMTMVDQTYTVESAFGDETVRATGLTEEQLDELKKLPPSYAHNAIRALAKFDAIIENDRAMIPSPEKTADQLREWQKVGTCPECGGTGEIELFVGVSPCSRGCEKP